VLVAVPNANSGQTKPAAGWPVAIFQHGITRNRTDMLAIAPTLAAAGFVTIAIDEPLHGVTNSAASPTNPFYRNQLFFGTPAAGLMTGERTFDLDLMDNATGASGPDGNIDSSGAWFVNLSSLITSRDNLRQAEADILHLARSVAAFDLDQNPGALTAEDIDETRIRFVGHSLGAILGTTALAIDDSTIQAASLVVPGGGLGKLLDASASFGPRIAAGLAGNFVFEGTDTYETFVRFAQHLVDPGDPINYAAAANANHAIHLIEVIGDTVVPNNAASTCPPAADLPPLVASGPTIDAAGSAAGAAAAAAALLAHCPAQVIPAESPLGAITYQDETVLTGYLSGTDPLIDAMGITDVIAMGSAPFAAQSNASDDTVVQFAPDTAEHGTVLTPNASSNATQPNGTFLPATCAMQKQVATFLASNGALLPIGGSCP
jgi:dienelactone hydrolase